MNRIIYQNNNQYIKKIKKRPKQELYEYLRNRNFLHFLEPVEETTSYELYRNINDNVPATDKAQDLIYLMALLHTKTTTYEEQNLDDIKRIYEETKSSINKTRDYYYAIHDHMEENVYLSPAEYLYLRNSSNVYKLLNLSEQLLDNWYNIQKNEKNIRTALLHQDLTLKSLKEEDNEFYLTNWDNYNKDLVIYDFFKFYQNEYKHLEMTSLFDLYQSKYPLTMSEKYLLLSLLAIPPQITFNKSNYENTVSVRYLTIYVEKTLDFISKYNKKDQTPNS